MKPHVAESNRLMSEALNEDYPSVSHPAYPISWLYVRKSILYSSRTEDAD